MCSGLGRELVLLSIYSALGTCRSLYTHCLIKSLPTLTPDCLLALFYSWGNQDSEQQQHFAQGHFFSLFFFCCRAIHCPFQAEGPNVFPLCSGMWSMPNWLHSRGRAGDQDLTNVHVSVPWLDCVRHGHRMHDRPISTGTIKRSTGFPALGNSLEQLVTFRHLIVEWSYHGRVKRQRAVEIWWWHVNAWASEARERPCLCANKFPQTFFPLELVWVEFLWLKTRALVSNHNSSFRFLYASVFSCFVLNFPL